MTPCEKLGYKVGDTFAITDRLPDGAMEAGTGFKAGQIVTLARDDGSMLPLFSGDNLKYYLCDDDAQGAYVHLSLVTKVEDAQ